MVEPVDQLSPQLFFFRPAEFFQTTVENHQIVAAIEFLLDRHRLNIRERIGHLRLAYEIAAPEIHRIDTKIPGGYVKKPFAKKISLETPRSAIGADRRFVGHHHVRFQIDVGNAVRPRHELCHVARADRPVGTVISAGIDPYFAPQPQDRAVARTGDLYIAIHFAGMPRCQQMLAPVFDPFHRASGMAGGTGNEEIFRKEFASCPKAATDVILDHLDGCLRQADHRGENFAVGKRNLGGTMNRQKFRGRIPFGQDPARLHRQRQMALCGELLTPNIVG